VRKGENSTYIFLFCRWMHLAHALVYKQANDDYDFSDLIATKLITHAEAARLAEFTDLSLTPIVYGWVLTCMTPSKKKKKKKKKEESPLKYYFLIFILQCCSRYCLKLHQVLQYQWP
jgi:hypothetical protein